MTVFDADFAPEPAVAEKDCLDISGTWQSNATYYYRLPRAREGRAASTTRSRWRW